MTVPTDRAARCRVPRVWTAVLAVAVAAGAGGSIAGCAERQGPVPLIPVSGQPGSTAGPGSARPATVPPSPPGASGGAAGSAVVPPATGTPPAAAPALYVFPVPGRAGYSRDHDGYPATDVMAPCGTPVRAVTGGVVLEVSLVDRYSPGSDDGASRGGLSVSLLGDDGVRYYGSHLAAVADGLTAGSRVLAGQRLGRVGETGRAGACHLHFGISPPCARTGDWWVRRGVVWPWPYLDAWRSGAGRSPAPAARDWQAAHGCPDAPPPGA